MVLRSQRLFAAVAAASAVTAIVVVGFAAARLFVEKDVDHLVFDYWRCPKWERVAAVSDANSLPGPPCVSGRGQKPPSVGESPLPQKDVVLLYARGYAHTALCPVLRSLLRTGFSGDVVVFAEDFSGRAAEKLTELGTNVRVVDARKFKSDTFARSSAAPHICRFHVMHRWLLETATNVTRWEPCATASHRWCSVHTVQRKYRFVVAVDARDVIFQRNPSEFLEVHLGRSVDEYGRPLELVVGSESFSYRCDCSGFNYFNMRECAPDFLLRAKDEIVYNVGEIAGTQGAMMQLMRSIYEEAKHNPAPICDQALLNQIVREEPTILERALLADVCIGWAVSVVHMSSFDIRLRRLDHPVVASVDANGTVSIQCRCQPHSTLPVIVHQYNQITGADELKDAISRPFRCS